MKRRTFGLLAGSSMLAVQVAGKANAQTAPASSLGAGLTPMGSEQAGNADGSIPAWTGGITTMPAGLKPGDYVPELFPDEQPVVVIDAGNMADHAAMLTDGVKAMMTKYGFKIKVYPTHRTSSMPQYVYDNIAKNLTTAKFTSDDPVGGRLGFEGAFGGIPFPVPDTSNPLKAGGQIIWNNIEQWQGYTYTLLDEEGWSVSNGHKSMAYRGAVYYKYPYYNPAGQQPELQGNSALTNLSYSAPGNLVGQALVVWDYINPYRQNRAAWELLNGQGRVRRAPEVSFDTPAAQFNGIAGYDESYGWDGSPEKYDWKYISKQEMYIPYNNNKIYGLPAANVLLDHFLDPEVVRWEKHRCWLIEATLHTGERNVLAKRRFWVDEDTWRITISDAYDASMTLFKTAIIYNDCRPDLPGTTFGNCAIHNLQSDDYVTTGGAWNQATHPSIRYGVTMDDSLWDPNHLAASAQY